MDHVTTPEPCALWPCPRRDDVAVAHVDHADHRDPAGRGDGHDIPVLPVWTHGILLSLRSLDGMHAVAEDRRTLVLQALGGGLHVRLQALHDLGVVAAEQRQGTFDHAGVVARRDLVHAGRAAAPDLVVEARSRALFQLAIATRAKRVHGAQEPQRATHALGARERSEVLGAVALDLANESKSREVVRAVDANEQVGLVVLEPQVVGRLVLLDERVLEQQGLFGRAGRDHVHVGRTTHEQPHEEATVAALAEVAAGAAAQIGRLADVEHAPLVITPAIDPGSGREALYALAQLGLGSGSVTA